MEKSQVIAEMLDQSRKFNRFYISKLSLEHIHDRYELNGVQMNSAYWIVGHLAWGEAGILQESCNGPKLFRPWMKHFSIGQQPSQEAPIPFGDLLGELDEVHQLSLEYIRSLSDEDLEQPAFVAPARWDTVVRKALYHGIRHESFHTGQLSWIAKVQGAQLP